MWRIALAYIVALALGAAAMAVPYAWQANPGPQTRFLSSTAFEVLYGGAAGGGKSDGLLMGVLYPERLSHPRFSAIIFRRTYPDLEGTLIERSRTLIPAADPRATYNEAKHVWRFGSGGRLCFAHLEHEKNKYDHQGAEYCYIGFDELTQFTLSQYTYLLSRARSSAGLLVEIRATTNPGGEGHEWVKHRWAPWLDPESPVKAGPGEKLWYAPDGEYVPRGTPHALSRVFIPAKLSDNPKLDVADPGYRTRLLGLDPVTRAQLLDGNWLIKPAAGLYFKRSWVEIVDAAPADGLDVRYWDRAATAPSKSNPDPDWTRGVRGCLKNGILFIEDVASTRDTPGGVEAFVKTTTTLDGKGVRIGIEQDPGSAGKSDASSYVRLLAGYDVRTYPVAKNKVLRFQPVSAQAQAGNVKIVRGAWNKAYLDELEAFPDRAWHDDQCVAAGTLIETDSGPCPIEAVRPDTLVETRAGLRRVLLAMKTGSNAEVLILTLGDGRVLRATPNHPIFANGAFRRLDSLRLGDEVITWSKWSSSTESNSGDTQMPQRWPIVDTSGPASPTLNVESRPSTRRFGSFITAPFRSVARFITRMGTGTTTTSPISPVSLRRNIATSIRTFGARRTTWPTWRAFGLSLPTGIARKRAGNGIGNTPDGQPLCGNQPRGNVKPVGPSSRDSGPTPSSAPPAAANKAVSASLSDAPVLGAESPSIQGHTPPGLVPMRVVSIRADGRSDVYNLQVDGEHEYFANGVLTHNCDATSGLYVAALEMAGMSVAYDVPDIRLPFTVPQHGF